MKNELIIKEEELKKMSVEELVDLKIKLNDLSADIDEFIAMYEEK